MKKLCLILTSIFVLLCGKTVSADTFKIAAFPDQFGNVRVTRSWKPTDMAYFTANVNRELHQFASFTGISGMS